MWERRPSTDQLIVLLVASSVPSFAGRAPKAYFNGGLRKIGFVIYSPEGGLEYARGCSDPAWTTNNVAELNALLECIRYLASEAGL